MDPREAVGWVCLVLIGTLCFFESTAFVSALTQQIAEASAESLGVYLDPLNHTSLNRFIVIGRIGQLIAGVTILVCLLVGPLRGLKLRRRGS